MQKDFNSFFLKNQAGFRNGYLTCSHFFSIIIFFDRNIKDIQNKTVLFSYRFQ